MVKGVLIFVLISVSAQARTLSFPLPDAPAVLDWTGAVTTTEAPIINLMEAGLFRYAYPSGKLVPALAESVKKSKDLKEYTFTIRKNAKWSDGRAVRASDFVASWLRVVAPQSTSLYNYYLFDVVNAREFHEGKVQDAKELGFLAKDDATLVVKLKHPIAEWEAITTFWPLYPVRKDLIEAHGANAWRAGVVPSSGAFVLESLEPSKKLVLKRNPHDDAGKSNVDQVEIWFDQNADAIFEKFKSGQYALIPNLKTALKQKFEKSPELKHPQVYRNQILVSNPGKFPMNNRDFRKAVFLSLDRNLILKNAGFDARVAKSMIPAPLPGSEFDLIQPRNIPEAKRALKASNVVLSPGFKLRILTRIDPQYFAVGKEIQEQLQRELGITVELSALHEREFSIYANLYDFDLILVGWSAKVPVPEDFLRPYGTDASNSRLKFDSPEYQQWVDEGRHEANRQKALQDFKKAQEVYLKTEMVLLPLLDENYAVLQKSNVKNVYFNHIALPVLRDAVMEGVSK